MNPSGRRRRSGEVWAVIAGGGTAGHVLPGIAVGRALTAAGREASSIHFVGSARGVESRLVPEAGFPLTLLPGRGIERRLSVRSVGAVLGLIAAIVRAVVIFGRRRPKVVLALGGYASVPCALAAVAWRVPIVVAEQNAVPGAANRLVGRFAKACAVAFAGTDLPRAVTTGNPVRPEVLEVGRGGAAAKQAAREKLGIEPGRRLVLVFGGSLGALRINQAVLEALELWRGRDDLAVRHITGARDFELVSRSRAASTPGELQYQVVPYDDDMPTALAAADVAVCRPGSGTSFELAAAGLPGIVVPSPNVTADHQSANAARLASAGAVRVVRDAELDGKRLASEVCSLLADPDLLQRMSTAMQQLSAPRAASDIADLMELHARD